MRWFNLGFWKYILEKPAKDISLWTSFWCRLRGHPEGVVWYNPGGLEPDMHCKKCFDDIG